MCDQQIKKIENLCSVEHIIIWTVEEEGVHEQRKTRSLWRNLQRQLNQAHGKS